MSEDSSEEYIGLVEEIRNKYGTLALNISVVLEIILSNKEAGDKFK